MIKKKFRIYLILFIPFLLNSCSIAGSWVYERIDSYLADYFIEFADFNQLQKPEIYKTSKEFKEDINLAEIMAIIDVSWYDSSNSITMQRVRKFRDKMMQNYNN